MDFPTIAGSYQLKGGGDSGTGFLVDFSGLGSAAASTYYGSNTSVNAVAEDPAGGAFIGGSAGYVPTTPGAYQGRNNVTGNATVGFYADLSPSLETIGLTFPQNQVLSGGLVAAVVQLSSIAPQGGASLTMSSDDPNLLIPTILSVPQNTTTITVDMTAKAVTTPTAAKISVLYNGVTATGSIILCPPVLKSLTVNKLNTTGGSPSTITVALPASPGPNPVVISLKSSVPAALTVPATLTIQNNSTSGTFTCTTVPVDVNTAVTVTATFGTSTLTGVVNVTAPLVSVLNLAPLSVYGGTASVGTVVITSAAGPSGLKVPLLSGATWAQVPATVLVPAGKTSATFAISTKAVDEQVIVQITASYLSSVSNKNLTINPPIPLSVTANPATVAGGATTTGTVTLVSPAGPSGAKVSLGSVHLTLATVPATVLVPAGKTTATFPIATTQQTANISDVISATYNGTEVTGTINLTPNGILSLAIVPATVTGGSRPTGTVTLKAPIDNVPITVALKSSLPTIANPQYASVSCNVPGKNSTTFLINTATVNVPTAVTISATCAGVVKTAVITVTPASLANLAISSVSVKGGLSATGTITLVGASGSLGTTVTLLSNNVKAVVPASVKVVGGKASISFTVTTLTVTANTVVTITAKLGTVTKTATLTITP